MQHRVLGRLIGGGLLLGLLAACNGPTYHSEPAAAGDYDVAVRIDPPNLQEGQKATINYAFTRHGTGKQATDLPLAHEATVHTTLVNHDLTWFRTGKAAGPVGGAYPVNLKFAGPDAYWLYAAFTTGYTPTTQLIYTHTIRFGLDQPPLEEPAPLVESATRENAFYGVAVRLDTGGALHAKQPAKFHYTLSVDGQPVRDLAPLDGAAGHLFAISADREEFSHTLAEEGGAGAPRGPDLDFEHEFEKAGLYKTWVQFNYHGQPVTADYVVRVEP